MVTIRASHKTRLQLSHYENFMKIFKIFNVCVCVITAISWLISCIYTVAFTRTTRTWRHHIEGIEDDSSVTVQRRRRLITIEINSPTLPPRYRGSNGYFIGITSDRLRYYYVYCWKKIYPPDLFNRNLRRLRTYVPPTGDTLCKNCQIIFL